VCDVLGLIVWIFPGIGTVGIVWLIASYAIVFAVREMWCGRFWPVHQDDGYFDEGIAARYDDDSAEMFDPAILEPVIDFLGEMAGNDRVLELGIGTGRVALPLARRGVQIHGIDLSEAMVAKLRSKPGGGEIDVTIGDFATASVDGPFALAYLVFNTIGNLTTQDAQVACFRNVAAHLQPGGRFVIEVEVPQLRRLPPGEIYRVFESRDGYWGIDEFDVANQGLISHHLSLVDGDLERFSMPFRYVWPAELDLMARLAGMELHERWADGTESRSRARATSMCRCGRRWRSPLHRFVRTR